MMGSEDWVLVSKSTGEEVKTGSFLVTFRKEACKLLSASPPHKPSSSGKVWCDFGEYQQELYPSVVGLRFIPRSSQ